MGDSFTLYDLQNIEANALRELKKICDNQHITFFMRGGSALGTVKYGGFVPWDDDVDIALPREDYNKLISVMPQKFGDIFMFISYQKTEGAHCYFPRVILPKEYCEEHRIPQNNERGLVLIDVLPLDGMPDSSLGLKLHIIKAYFYRILASVWTYEIKNTISMHTGKKDKIIGILHKMGIHHLYRQDSIYRKLDRMYSKYVYGETGRSGMLASSKLKKEIVPTAWYGEGEAKCFRDMKVLVPQNYDGYLKQLFGDNYLTYEPPVSERKKSHITGEQ